MNRQACIAEINGYLRDMAIAGYVPCPETVEAIKARYGVTDLPGIRYTPKGMRYETCQTAQ